MVAIEDLQIKNMSSSAKGNIEKPGKNVKAKSGLNRAILDQGWFEARRQLEYKQLWRGGIVVADHHNIPVKNVLLVAIPIKNQEYHKQNFAV